MGSPLYATILDRAAADAAARGPVWAVLAGYVDDDLRDRRASALALRFMGAVHRMVLSGEAPQLARHFPSAGGDGDAEAAWSAFATLLTSHGERVTELVALPCQTNEVGRAAGLAVGFLAVAARHRLPLRLLEVGASAGLNLRWDCFRYEGWGDPSSPVDLRGLWDEPPPHLGVSVEVVERSGCDRRPVDPTSPDGRLTLSASLWADQLERFTRLQGAFEVAATVPATVDSAEADEWSAARLAAPTPGVLTILYHSVMEEYLGPDARARLRATVADAGGRAGDNAPLAWVRLEPVSELRRHGVTVTTWPGGEERLVATCGAHGQGTRYLP
jgi:hypothetical protein